ncbi:MAG: 16S rRNA (cytosine(1402)-N(4))-methyltransferase RsmH [Bdellovibrio sp.]
MEGSHRHLPVLLREVLSETEFLRDRPDARIGDLTAGRGGHAKAFLEVLPRARLELWDQDPEAVSFLRELFLLEAQSGRISLQRANFADVDWVAESFDFLLADLGVSSPQLDNANRGFSFLKDGPLDMRMNPGDAVTAAQILQDSSEEDLIQIFKTWGEVRSPYRVVRAIVHDRKKKAFQTTRELASLIERVEGWRKRSMHPATLYFQALRLEVNQEIPRLQQVLPKLLQALRPSGRLVVLTFHSLEDRLVKQCFRSSDLGAPRYKKVVTASHEETELNPRSRSAKMRVFERGEGVDRMRPSR